MNISSYLNPHYEDFFACTDREVLLRGGGNAGKTYSVADKLIIQAGYQWKEFKAKTKALVIRRTLPSVKDTAWNILRQRAETLRCPWSENRQENIAHAGAMTILFRSMNNQEDYIKIKSLTDVDFIWINEIIDLRETDYQIIKTRLRGGQASFSQIIGDFNPVAKSSWIYDRFYVRNNGKGVGNPRKLGPYTVYHNPWASEEEIQDIESQKEDDYQLWRIYCQGEWGEPKGQIYSWNEDELPTDDLGWYDEIYYGLDFGYSVDPAAVIRIYRKADKHWAQEVIYARGLTNQALAQRMREEGVSERADIYADSAEPKSIDELCHEGFNVYPSLKGRDSVAAGIDFLKSMDIQVTPDSPEIKKELGGYVRKKDKDGYALKEPVKKNDHAMDAIRYAIYTHNRGVVTDGEILIV